MIEGRNVSFYLKKEKKAFLELFNKIKIKKFKILTRTVIASIRPIVFKKILFDVFIF